MVKQIIKIANDYYDNSEYDRAFGWYHCPRRSPGSSPMAIGMRIES
jgi:hypothetical protein